MVVNINGINIRDEFFDWSIIDNLEKAEEESLNLEINLIKKHLFIYQKGDYLYVKQFKSFEIKEKFILTYFKNVDKDIKVIFNTGKNN
jgi:hypothetical protein